MSAGVLDMRREGRVRFGAVVVVFLLIVLGMGGMVGRAAEVMPPKPPLYFNDYAHVVSDAAAEDLNQQLEQFEKDTSNQVWVAIYPKMQSDSSIDDYTRRVADSWGVGKKTVNNGVVFFLFVDEGDGQQAEFIQVGRGLEGALPDATCKEIVDEVGPHLKAGHDAGDAQTKSAEYEAGLRGAVAGIIAATKGEYKGNGRTGYEQAILGHLSCIGVSLAIFLGFGFLLLVVHFFGGTFYQHHARSLSFFENFYLFIFQIGLNILFSAGSSGSGSGGSSGYSSSGGGSFGGGGAGGKW